MLILKLSLCFVLLAGPCMAKKPHPHPIPPQGNCNQIEAFAGQFKRFFDQVPLYVYPAFTICSNKTISNFYARAMEYWKNATEDHICQVMNFERRSKTNPAQMMHDQLVSFWDQANCQDCHDRRNETTEFFQLFNGLDGCIKQETDQGLSPCGPCADTYQKVQTMYEGLAKGRKNSICFDVEDRMNQTRHRWSAEFNCCKNKQHSKATFIGAASGFCSIPLIFYLVMFFVTRRKEAIDELVAGAIRSAGEEEPQPGSSREGIVVGGYEGEDSDDEPAVGHKEIGGADEELEERKLNNLDVIREDGEPKEDQQLDLVSNGSGSTVDVNLDRSGMKGSEEDDVSLLGHEKANVVVERNLLD